MTMKTIKYSNARQTLRTVIDDCVNNNEPVTIVSKSNKVVIISEAQYLMMIDEINGDK
ncbi:MAG TPA: type II toxin-antitoxin system Phd/YefM family antitoxin [Flavobacteriales bacterium]|nr:type II toxin-antitoxin system Phd/YefM family antitoxin [Flavobacteriales bacterium]